MAKNPVIESKIFLQMNSNEFNRFIDTWYIFC